MEHGGWAHSCRIQPYMGYAWDRNSSSFDRRALLNSICARINVQTMIRLVHQWGLHALFIVCSCCQVLRRLLQFCSRWKKSLLSILEQRALHWQEIPFESVMEPSGQSASSFFFDYPSHFHIWLMTFWKGSPYIHTSVRAPVPVTLHPFNSIIRAYEEHGAHPLTHADWQRHAVVTPCVAGLHIPYLW